MKLKMSFVLTVDELSMQKTFFLPLVKAANKS